MRCFVAVKFPDEILEKIEKIQKELPLFKGKLTEKENLHLTLKFLGDIDEKKLDKVKERLRNTRLENFEAEIDSIGVFSEAYVRIIWLHLKGAEKLQKKIDEILSGLFEKERRFMSHITIARVKNLDNKKEFLELLNGIKFEKIEFPINEFFLMKSDLNKKGPVYKVLERFNLNKI